MLAARAAALSKALVMLSLLSLIAWLHGKNHLKLHCSMYCQKSDHESHSQSLKYLQDQKYGVKGYLKITICLGMTSMLHVVGTPPQLSIFWPQLVEWVLAVVLARIVCGFVVNYICFLPSIQAQLSNSFLWLQVPAFGCIRERWQYNPWQEYLGTFISLLHNTCIACLLQTTLSMLALPWFFILYIFSS